MYSIYKYISIYLYLQVNECKIVHDGQAHFNLNKKCCVLCIILILSACKKCTNLQYRKQRKTKEDSRKKCFVREADLKVNIKVLYGIK